MKNIFVLTVLNLILAITAQAEQTNKVSTITIKYSAVELCDSGFCDSFGCSVTKIDSFGNESSKFYYEGSHYPRICSALLDGQSVYLEYTYGRSGSGVCEQNLEKSDIEILDLTDSDCFSGL